MAIKTGTMQSKKPIFLRAIPILIAIHWPKNPKSSKGTLKDFSNGLWQLSSSNFEGDILLTYLVEDANGAVVSANQSFTVRQAVLEGTNQTESITGTRDEWVYAHNGFDTIRAAGGDDRAYGGYGNDTIRWL